MAAVGRLSVPTAKKLPRRQGGIHMARTWITFSNASRLERDQMPILRMGISLRCSATWVTSLIGSKDEDCCSTARRKSSLTTVKLTDTSSVNNVPRGLFRILCDTDSALNPRVSGWHAQAERGHVFDHKRASLNRNTYNSEKTWNANVLRKRLCCAFKDKETRRQG